MIRATTIKLIAEDPHGVFENHTPQITEVFAEVRSVTMKEFYLAQNDGIQPEKVFRLTDEADYHGEKLIEHDGVLYDVIRSYIGKGQSIEITVHKKEINA